MNKRLLFHILPAVIAIACSALAAADSVPDKPNVILIYFG